MARQLEGASGAGDELLDVVVIGGSQAGLCRGVRPAGQGELRVTALIRTAEGFEARTDDGIFRARQVVVATGPFQVPVSACPVMRSRHRWLHLPLRSRPGAHRSTW